MLPFLNVWNVHIQILLSEVCEKRVVAIPSFECKVKTALLELSTCVCEAVGEGARGGMGLTHLRGVQR